MSLDERDPLAKLVPLPLSEKTHDNAELHFIGNAILKPFTVSDVIPGVDGSVGVLPAPAREDHVHGMASTGGVAPPLDMDDAVAGILDVLYGGTGVAALAAGQYLIGNGTSPVTTTTGPVPIPYIPTWVNFTPGNGVYTAYYMTFGKLLLFALMFTLGNTSSVAATGPIRAVIPGGNTSLLIPVVAHGSFRDVTPPGFSYPIMAECVSSGNSLDLYAHQTDVNPDYVTRGASNSSVPFGWTNGDIIRLAALFFIV